jgi:hypothetical protein
MVVSQALGPNGEEPHRDSGVAKKKPDASDAPGMKSVWREKLAGRLLRDFGAFFAGFGEPDRDGLLATLHRATLTALS